jgi:hypothetical protein
MGGEGDEMEARFLPTLLLDAAGKVGLRVRDREREVALGGEWARGGGGCCCIEDGL